ncbi:RIP metalloprotease RseP [Candidatus Woesebacteria bacterium]|nr:RIP metalloprotease RseP [Candidatus Woesebacteria bacterium]
MTIIIFIIILLVLVLVHEFGHFFAAKKQGIYVEEFGFGFPPRLFGKKRGETLYSLNLLPIGGFVKLYGEEYHESHKELKHKGKTIPASRAFVNKKPWQKTIVIVGGVIMNFILGWVLISYLFTVGTPVPNGIKIVEVQKNSPAEDAHLMKGDHVLYLQQGNEKNEIQTTNDLVELSGTYGDQEVMLGFERDGETSQVQIIPRAQPPKGEGALGVVITQDSVVKKYPWYQAPFYGLAEAASMTRRIVVEIVKIPAQLIAQQKTKVDFAGPVGIAQVVGEARAFGLNALLQIVALLSLNLAVVNILPLPALDGGRLVFILYEWITGKKPNEKLEQHLNTAGITFLLLLTVLITINDIVRLVK